jgi:hypothetical protein
MTELYMDKIPFYIYLCVVVEFEVEEDGIVATSKPYNGHKVKQ